MNFYLAGLAPGEIYSASLVVERGRNPIAEREVAFRSGDFPFEMALPLVIQEAPPGPEGVLLQFSLFARAIATDLNGTVLWYGPPDLNYLTHPEPGGTFFASCLAPARKARSSAVDLVG
jgi:hypothetical protein